MEDVHLRRVTVGGMTIAGFEGCVRYGQGGPHQYTQKEAPSSSRSCRPPTC